MKTIIKSTLAVLLIVGSTHASANDGELDITQMLTQNIASYIDTTTKELKNSLTDTLLRDSQLFMNEFIKNATDAINTDVKQLKTAKPNAVKALSNEG